VNHLKGVYLSKKHMQPLAPIEARAAVSTEVERARHEYRKYVNEHGLSKSCSIQREHGDEISLMTEIVLKSSDKDMYPAQSKRSSKVSKRKLS